MLRTLNDINIDGKRVFIRCDFNVPKDEFGNITDDRRIRSALQTMPLAPATENMLPSMRSQDTLIRNIRQQVS